MNMQTLYGGLRVLLLYGIIGCFSSALDFIIYTLLLYAGLHYLPANCISVVVGITTSFTLNRLYNFRVKDDILRRFTIFLTVGLCGMLLSNVILYICIDRLEMDKLIAKLISIVLVVGVQFVINKHITFKPKK